jgi:uncharacterized OB-fold protein
MTAETPYAKPLPRMLPETAGFWEAARRHQFVVQRCTSCGRQQYFPRAVCHHCLSESLSWEEVSGRGVIHSFTIIRQVQHAGFSPDVPYVYAIIDLEEGLRLIANIVRTPHECVRVGLAVKVAFADVTPDLTLIQFEST